MSFNENLYLQSLRNYLDFVKSFQEQHLRLLLLLLRCCQNGEGVFLNFQAIIMKKISKQTKYWLTPLFKKKKLTLFCFSLPQMLDTLWDARRVEEQCTDAGLFIFCTLWVFFFFYILSTLPLTILATVVLLCL